jgi:hypothetical protein
MQTKSVVKTPDVGSFSEALQHSGSTAAPCRGAPCNHLVFVRSWLPNSCVHQREDVLKLKSYEVLLLEPQLRGLEEIAKVLRLHQCDVMSL